MSKLLWRSSLRYLRRHLWQSVLSIVGIALGVAVVVAIDLASSSAQRAFQLSAESVAGKATHQLLGGPQGIPESLYRDLRVGAGIRSSAPIVEGDVAAPDYPGRTLHLLGIDPFADALFRPQLAEIDQRSGELASLITSPGSVLISGELAGELGLSIGEELSIRVGTQRKPVTIVALLQPQDEAARRGLDSLLIADIASAQQLLGLRGQLSRIDLLLPEGEQGQALTAQIQRLLPPGVTLVRSGARSEALEQMTRAFNLNLSAMSLLALIVGMFLVYNTVVFSVVQRRTLIGTMRALGVTRREIFTLVLGESLFVGAIGTALGLLLGIVLARGLLQLVTRTINDLYFVLSVRELLISPAVLLKGVLLGLGATVVAALLPAIEATTAPPRAVLSRSTIESRVRRLVPRISAGGLLLCAAGALLLAIPSQQVGPGFAALLMIVVGCALLTPLATIGFMWLVRPLMGQLFGILGRMSARGVVTALSRTAIAIAALMVAVAVTVGVSIMVGSFRQSVARWLESSLRSDIYVSAPSLISNRSDSTLDPALVQRLAETPGIAVAHPFRNANVDSPLGLTLLVALEVDQYNRESFVFKSGDPQAIWPAFDGGAALVSEPYAYRHGLQVGSRVQLRTDRGLRDFPVAGIFYDYGSDQGSVMLQRATYHAYWDDRGVSSLGIFLQPGTSSDSVIAALRQRAGSAQELNIQSNRELRTISLEIFDRTFAITTVLQLLATTVAFIGVLSALMALQLERAREFGVLRANGLTPRQLWGMVTSQTGLMGLVAGLLAMPVGLILALVLVQVINQRSFGWELEILVDPLTLLQALGLALLAALIAGIYPALKMARTSPALALREE